MTNPAAAVAKAVLCMSGFTSFRVFTSNLS
jgi:hypothetical protein